MKSHKWIYILIVVMALLMLPACQEDKEEKSENAETQSVEQTEDTYQDEAVSPEFDENGNPAGEYAQYLWEQQQKEDAMNSLVEDAMREEYEEDYEDHTFPLD